MKHFLFIFALFLFAACSKNPIELPGEGGGGTWTGNPLSGDISTPTFNYQMAGKVTIHVTDPSSDATYTVFSFNDDKAKSQEVEVTDPDTGDTQTFNVDIPEKGSFDELGTMKLVDGKLEFDVPSDIEELFVRKQDKYGVSMETLELSSQRPLERQVVFQNHNTTGLKATQADDYSVLWGLNGKADLFTIDLSVSTNFIDQYGGLTSDPLTVVGETRPSKDYQDLLGVNPQDQAKKIYTLKDAEPEDLTSEMLEEGSWTIAMDDANEGFYTISKTSLFLDNDNVYPVYYYPLVNMEDGNGEVDYGVTNGGNRYSKHEVVGYLNFTAPRLEYKDGFLYISTNKKIIQAIPRGDGTILILDEAGIAGLDASTAASSGGDIVCTDAPDANTPEYWYMASHGGFYQLGWEDNQGVTAYRKSADNLPFSPTSLAYSKHDGATGAAGSMWIADNFSFSSIYAADNNGGFVRKYQLPHACNDLTCANGGTDYTFTDQFPADDRFYKVDFPSKYGWGSIAFEDLYPMMNDYDFNDLVLDFRYEVYYTAEPKIHSIIMYFDVRHVNGATYDNGFGFTFEGVKQDWIRDVFYENDVASGESFQRDGYGIEAGLEPDEDAVFMVFDSQKEYNNRDDKQIKVTIRFNENASNIDFYNNFNPFLIVMGDRSCEVHCPDKKTTSKHNFEKFEDFYDFEDTHYNLDVADPINPDGTGHILNLDNDYRGVQVIDDKAYKGFPWVLILPHRFNYPTETTPILQAYKNFREWANMSQVEDNYNHDVNDIPHYEDWYSNDNATPGYYIPYKGDE